MAGWTPRWNSVPRMSWDSRGFARASLTGRFVSSYQDSIALVSGPNAGEFQTLGNFWMLDLNVDLAIGSLFIDTRFLSGARLSLGATNLFNKLPDFCAGCGARGYDGSQYDIDGRTVYRSEEHTSELQSLMRISYAVFCLKKKKDKHQNKSI